MKKYDGKVIDINATALKLKDKCFDLLAIHALSGCDSVSYPFGKGKVSAINLLLKSDLKLEIFSDPEANETDWLTAGTKFLSASEVHTIQQEEGTVKDSESTPYR